jgi:hypothetical protein
MNVRALLGAMWPTVRFSSQTGASGQGCEGGARIAATTTWRREMPEVSGQDR